MFGSADLTSTLMEHDLIDEYHLGINPVILGRGTPLFKGSSQQAAPEAYSRRGR